MARNLQVKKRTQLCPLFCVASVLHVYPATVPFGTVRVPFWLSQSKEKARTQAVFGLYTCFLVYGLKCSISELLSVTVFAPERLNVITIFLPFGESS